MIAVSTASSSTIATSANERILVRYLARERVRDDAAFEDAQRDYRDAAGRREAVAALPREWADLLAESEELLLDIVIEKAEALSGYKPAAVDVLSFLRRLKPDGPAPLDRQSRQMGPVTTTVEEARHPPLRSTGISDRSVAFTISGPQHTCPTASLALVEILGAIAARDPARIAELADAVRGRSRNLIARTVAEINPARPDLAHAVEFAPGWLIGLNISNRHKMAIIRSPVTCSA